MKKYAWVPLALLGGGLIAVGLSGGQAMDVYRKAIMVCLECIGIG